MLLAPIEIHPVSRTQLQLLGRAESDRTLQTYDGYETRNGVRRDHIAGAKDQVHRFESVSLYERRSLSLFTGHGWKMNYFTGHKVMKSHYCIPRFQAV